MEYRPLGRTGVSVSQLCLGAMMFGAFGNPDHDDAIKIIHKALDAGINFIDTADGYSAGESEEIVGKALADGRRENVVLAVKFGPPFGADPNHRGASRRWITEGVEGSLRRLQTDWIDLYQVGVPDPNTDIDETLGALSDLVHAGKIRSFGASKVPASADRRGPVDRRAPRPRTVPHRAAPLLNPDPRHRVRRAADLPAPRNGRHDLQPAGRRLAVGQVPQGPGGQRAGLRRSRPARRGLSTPPTRPTPQSSTPPTPSARSPTRPG